VINTSRKINSKRKPERKPKRSMHRAHQLKKTIKTLIKRTKFQKEKKKINLKMSRQSST